MKETIKKGIGAYADAGDKVVKNLSKTELGSSLVQILGMPKAIDLLKSLSKDKKAKGGMINKYAKGGEVKKYMGGGSVHKKKNKMLTTKGWGASRKT
jgi:hypothetical protein